jgi:dynein heavy chain
LVKDSFIAKPAFANHLMETNKLLYEMGNVKTISDLITQNRTLEIEEFFNTIEKRKREEA